MPGNHEDGSAQRGRQVKVAVYLDLENLIWTFHEAAWGRRGRRSAWTGGAASHGLVPIDRELTTIDFAEHLSECVRGLDRRLAERHRAQGGEPGTEPTAQITLRRGYWSSRSKIDQVYREAMQRLRVGRSYVSQGDGLKNAGDIQAVIDTLDDVILQPTLKGAAERPFDAVIVGSGDADFAPLVSKLRDHGIDVFGLVAPSGVSESTLNDVYDGWFHVITPPRTFVNHPHFCEYAEAAVIATFDKLAYDKTRRPSPWGLRYLSESEARQAVLARVSGGAGKEGAVLRRLHATSWADYLSSISNFTFRPGRGGVEGCLVEARGRRAPRREPLAPDTSVQPPQHEATAETGKAAQPHQQLDPADLLGLPEPKPEFVVPKPGAAADAPAATRRPNAPSTPAAPTTELSPEPISGPAAHAMGGQPTPTPGPSGGMTPHPSPSKPSPPKPAPAPPAIPKPGPGALAPKPKLVPGPHLMPRVADRKGVYTPSFEEGRLMVRAISALHAAEVFPLSLNQLRGLGERLAEYGDDPSAANIDWAVWAQQRGLVQGLGFGASPENLMTVSVDEFAAAALQHDPTLAAGFAVATEEGFSADRGILTDHTWLRERNFVASFNNTFGELTVENLIDDRFEAVLRLPPALWDAERIADAWAGEGLNDKGQRFLLAGLTKRIDWLRGSLHTLLKVVDP